jgi:hypothetical protein
VLGGLRTLHMHHHADLQDRFDRLTVIAEDLAEGLEGCVGEVERLERRIATDHSTLAALLHSLAKLELADRQSLFGSAMDLIRLGVGATSFAVYLKGQEQFEPCVGVVDGTIVGTAAIPPLPQGVSADGGLESDVAMSLAEHAGAAQTPICAAIHLANGEPAGIIVCSRLHPAQDPIIARHRLGNICHLLATFLAACPPPASGTA